MNVGDTVVLATKKDVVGTIIKMPQSIGRKDPRVLIATLSGEQWVPLSSLLPYDKEATESLTSESE